jgi:hypothetical protein
MDVTGIALPSQAHDLTEAPQKGVAQQPQPEERQTTKSQPPEPRPVISPVVKMDGPTGAAVLSFRDPVTGEQNFQIPSRTALAYEQNQQRSNRIEASQNGDFQA